MLVPKAKIIKYISFSEGYVIFNRYFQINKSPECGLTVTLIHVEQQRCNDSPRVGSELQFLDQRFGLVREYNNNKQKNVL